MINPYFTGRVTHAELLNKFSDDNFFYVQCSKLTMEEEDFLNTLLKEILSYIGKDNIFEYISYVYREILNNAKKANIKRMYFKQKELDIRNPEDYKKGMANFKKDVFSNTDYFTDRLESEGFYIKTGYAVNNDNIEITIENNTFLTENEKTIIEDKIKNASEFNSVEDAMNMVSSNKEGAGLGLIISILILRKLSLNKSNLVITSNGEITRTSIRIPLNVTALETKEYIREQIINEIKDIPQFPDHILQIQEMLKNEDVDIKKLSQIIIKDASLAGRIIKFSNSPLYLTYREVSSISDAVKVIGLSGIKTIIYSYGSEAILSRRYDRKKLQEIFEHSNTVADISFHIARKTLPRYLLEILYISALIHDLGKILSTVLNDDLNSFINKICHEKGISLSVIEELAGGINHSMIGALLARKWNFPDLLIDVIENHHSPEKAADENRQIVYFVHLANIIVYTGKDTSKIYQKLTPYAKTFFNIKNESDINKILDNL